jgi:release factor glutamine methyltransferase
MTTTLSFILSRRATSLSSHGRRIRHDSSNCGLFPFLRPTCTSARTSCLNLVDRTGWTVQQVMDDAISQLLHHHVSEPQTSTEQLLAASLELDWTTGVRDLRLQTSRRLSQEEAQDFQNKLQRRLQYEPIQYILGQWDFLDYTVKVRPPLLCPRPETEELVMKIVEETQNKYTQQLQLRILDVGCGTGVIGIALAEKLGAKVEAIDIDPAAMATAQENADLILGSHAPSLYCTRLVSAAEYSAPHRFDVVVSNPPYIPQADMETLEPNVRLWENEQALCGGVDGMDVIRIIVQKLPYWCDTGAVCWMEVDPSHPKRIQEWLQESPEIQQRVRFEASYQDMFGRDRFVKLCVH